MIRNLKALGLSMVAVFAMTAVFASAASAASFYSSETPVSLHGGQTTTHLFTTNTGSVECTSATFTGTQSVSPATSVSIAPSYGGCKIPGLFEVAVVVNECDYVFKATTATTGTVDIATCGTNKYIQVGSLLTCRIRVPEQTNVGVVTYHEEGNNIKVTAEVVGLKYEESGFLCAGSGGTNGTYTGTTVVTGNEGSANLDVK